MDAKKALFLQALANAQASKNKKNKKKVVSPSKKKGK